MSDIALTGLEAMFFAIVLGVSAGAVALATLAHALGWAALPPTLGGLGLLLGTNMAPESADAWAWQTGAAVGALSLVTAAVSFALGSPTTAPAK